MERDVVGEVEQDNTQLALNSIQVLRKFSNLSKID